MKMWTWRAQMVSTRRFILFAKTMRLGDWQRMFLRLWRSFVWCGGIWMSECEWTKRPGSLRIPSGFDSVLHVSRVHAFGRDGWVGGMCAAQGVPLHSTTMRGGFFSFPLPLSLSSRWALVAFVKDMITRLDSSFPSISSFFVWFSRIANSIFIF